MSAGDDTAERAHFRELLVVLAPHVAKEEGSLFPMLARSEELFPAALATLDGSDWDEVDRWEQERLTAAGRGREHEHPYEPQPA